MIKRGVNYVRTPGEAKKLTREELLTEANRLENLSERFSFIDFSASNEYLAQARVLDMCLLDQMNEDDILKQG